LAALGVIIWSVHLLFKKRVSANKPVKPTQ
jgi:hypothetical protein